MSKSTPAQEWKQTQTAEKHADRKRTASKSVLNLSDVLGMDKTAAEAALSEINANTAVFAEQLTPKMLKTFQRQVRHIQKTHGTRGGITPRTVINRSRRIDIQRAQTEIPTVFAARQEKDGVVRFRTNASPQSKDTHHFVSVQFLDFQAALNAGKSDNRLAEQVLKGAVKFDCDCGRHRYWYRYIATIGGFAYGKPETAFPKIRNPELAGLGCKHVIRVMHTLQSTKTFVPMMKQMIARYRKNPNERAKATTAKQAKEQLERLEKHQGKTIRKRFTNAKEVIHAVKTAAAKLTAPSETAKALRSLDFLFKSGILTEKEYREKTAMLQRKTKG